MTEPVNPPESYFAEYTWCEAKSAWHIQAGLVGRSRRLVADLWCFGYGDPASYERLHELVQTLDDLVLRDSTNGPGSASLYRGAH